MCEQLNTKPHSIIISYIDESGKNIFDRGVILTNYSDELKEKLVNLYDEKIIKERINIVVDSIVRTILNKEYREEQVKVKEYREGNYLKN